MRGAARLMLTIRSGTPGAQQTDTYVDYTRLSVSLLLLHPVLTHSATTVRSLTFSVRPETQYKRACQTEDETNKK